MHKSLLVLGLVFGLLTGLAGSVSAHQITSASVSATCNSYTITVAGTALSPSGTVMYTITLTPASGPAIMVSNSIAVSPHDAAGDFSATQTNAFGPFTADFSLSGTAELIVNGGVESSIPISFSPSSSLPCQASPPPPPPCVATATNASNFNGTSVPAGTYLWFNANFTAHNVPTDGVTINFTKGNISFAAGGTSYSLAVPNAKITFSSSATCTSTTFDSVTNTWMTTVPISGDDEIFLTGLAWPVPSGGLPGGANPVDFSGTYSSETNAPGLSIQMKWSVAAYSRFTTDYNALRVKAGHQTACGESNGDHAGTPEGVDNTNTPWKHYLVGGPRGGGGSNFTGSWSGTLSIRICP
jgi:hypothetical protein